MSYLYRQRMNMVLSLALIFVVIGALAVYVLKGTATYFVERQAVEVAHMVVTLAKSARSVYADEVVKKLKADGVGAKVDYPDHKGYVPIPAQFLKLLGQASSKNTSDLFHYKPVSKWNLEPTQGLDDAFLKWSWPQLEAQDNASPTGPIKWNPVWRIEEDGGKKVLRYLAADPASTQLCVDCHNAAEVSPTVIALRKANEIPLGKQFKQNQLMGALSVTVPLDRIEEMAAAQIKDASVSIASILLTCMVFITWAFLRGARSHRKVASLAWEVTHDTLTQALNRKGFEGEIEELLENAKEENKTHVLAVMDLNGFKAINDTHGHQAGDELLKLVAATIKDVVGEQGTLARLGGDEFAVLLPNCPIYRANGIAIAIRDALQMVSVDWKGKSLRIGISIGLAKMDAKSPNTQSVVEAADAACYLAKKDGGNQIAMSE